ncbi:hypothetical protein CH276_07460 [Rhodococcus sp. 06-470-2]|nr:hypothetical protein CH276_07460 [Rhodococcus sp. 06-470-2]OZE58696.1 hypothetical protein CH265_21745 [Rhodococcus sp. 05-2221-1B]
MCVRGLLRRCRRWSRVPGPLEYPSWRVVREQRVPSSSADCWDRCGGWVRPPRRARSPEPDFVPIAKRSYSAFYATDLEVELRRRGRDQLIIVGVFASAGILATTFDAFARDIQCFVGIESIADYTAHQHRTALNLIASLTGTVTSSGNLLHDRHGGPLD